MVSPLLGIKQCTAYSWLTEASSDRYGYNTFVESRCQAVTGILKTQMLRQKSSPSSPLPGLQS